jgi:hypothetical protein
MSLTSLSKEQVVFRFNYLRALLRWTKEPQFWNPVDNSPAHSGIERPHKKRSGLVWFVAVVFFLADSLCGLIVWSYLSQKDNKKFCNELFVNLTYANLNVTKEGVQWLMGSPAGLKLNTPLTLFIGGHISGILEAWWMMFGVLVFDVHRVEFFTSVWLLLGISSVFGLSIHIALLLDVMKIFVGYILAFYNIFAFLHSMQVSILFALLRLFLGKKWNPLRKRVDSYEYDSSQLTIGTLLLSMSVFLFPTLGVYYLLFLFLKLALSLPRYLSRMVIVTINRLTILPLLLHIERTTFKLSQTEITIRNLQGERQQSSQQHQQQKQQHKHEHEYHQQQKQEQHNVHLDDSHHEREVEINLVHPMLPGQTLNILQFQKYVQNFHNSALINEYFTKQPTVERLPGRISQLSALHYFTPSFFPRIIYLIKCTILGIIFDF